MFDLLTFSTVVSNEQGDVNNIRRWICEHAVGSGQIHVSVQTGRTELQEGSADLVHKVNRYSAARSTYSLFGWCSLYLERFDKELDDNRPRTCGPISPSDTSFGDTVRISTVISGHKVLENFVQSVMRSKREKIKAITVFDVEEVTGFSPSRLEWRRRAIPSRSMETIDLDQGMKNEMIQNEMIQKFESFADPNRAGWYIERGVPYYCDYQFHGPPGTGN
jgi:hypothetical protein